jgi:non-lysosomal glucosylceramidase
MSGRSDKAFLQYNYAAVKQAMQFLRQFDRNGDGLIENDGYPDQTYDNWAAHRESAYSGGLYLGALRATEEMAKVLGDAATATDTGSLFKRAQQAYIKHLWNGTYFNYDVGSSYKDSVMAEQLAGQWYATLTGLGDLVPREMQRSALQHVYEYNVMKLANGTMGALNGISANGELLKDDEQTEEVWSGVTFAVAAMMLQNGLREDGFNTAKGVYNVVYEEKGYWFRTPEAWDTKGYYRASMYMRSGSIWSMEMASENDNNKVEKN